MKEGILLIRHGAPQIDWGTPLNCSQYRSWLVQYNSAPLLPGSLPSPRLRSLMAVASRVFCSELRRSQESCRVSGCALAPVVDPVFNEVELYIPPIPWVRFKPMRWVRIKLWLWNWLQRVGRKNAHDLQNRAVRAARILVSSAQESGGLSVLFGHGAQNRSISKVLVTQGWKCTDSDNPAANWGWQLYSLCEEGRAC